MDTGSYASNFFPCVLQCAQWCDRSTRCKSFSWGDRGNVVFRVTPETTGCLVYTFGHCIVSSVNRTSASLGNYPNYDFYEEVAWGPVVDPDEASIPGFLGPFQATAILWIFDDGINELFDGVGNLGKCAKMCADRKECRSFDYGVREPRVGECYLHRVDKGIAGPMFLPYVYGWDYYEKILEAIAVRVEEEQDLSILHGALVHLNLPDLANTGPFTFFAPSDDAFRAQGINSVADLLALPNVTAILEYHIALGKFEASTLEAGDQLLTAQGEKVAVTNASGTLHVGGESVSIADIECSNGVIHVMSGALSAPSFTKEPIIDMLAARGQAQLRQALQGLNVTDGLSQWTLFAPSDITIRAFRLSKYITDESAFLLSDEFRTLLRRHIIPEDMVLTSIADQGEKEFASLEGNKLRLTRTPGGGYFIYLLRL